jgi:predicted dehydrogenase
MKLRVGVVGVGSAWESRHLPALRALADRLEVAAVCDPVQHRAIQVAKQFNATVYDGFRALMDRDDIDCVMLLSSHFYGPTPIFAACDYGKAVYCAAALELEDEQATQLRERVQQSGIAFMAEFACRLSPATLRLKELLATRLGAPRLLFCNRRRSSPIKCESGDRCARDLVELVDWCRYVVEGDPTSLIATAHMSPDTPFNDYFAVSLDFSPNKEVGAGPVAIIGCGNYVPESLEESLAYRRPADLKVVCEKGIAFVDLPSTVAWFDKAGQHMEKLDHERNVGEQLLLHFHRAVESLVLKTASLDDAHKAIIITNQAKLSCRTGQRIWCK